MSLSKASAVSNIDFSFRPGGNLPFAEHDRLRARGPVSWSDSLGGWVVSSYDDVKRVLSETSNFGSEGTPIAEAFGGQAMLVIDTPLHHKIRNVWAKPASVSEMVRRRGDISAIVDRLLAPVADDLNAGQVVDLVPVFEAFTSEVITLLMDIPRERRDDFQRWNRVISELSVLELSPDDPRFAQRAAAKDEIFAFLGSEVEKRRRRLANGEQLSDLVSLIVAVEGQNGIGPEIALDNLLNLLLGALDTSVKWLGNVMVKLHDSPELGAALKADGGLLTQAAEEVMRLDTVVQVVMRLVRTDGVQIGGQELRAGDRMFVMPGAANRDPKTFEAADTFDLHRKRKLHMGFGFGIHQCLGINIARTEVETFVGAALETLPTTEIVEADYGSHWNLWGPVSLRLRKADHG